MLKKLERKEHIFLLALFVIAFAIRLGFTLFLKHQYFFYANPSSDVAYYQEWAREIATQNFIGTKIFFGLPLYPYFLAVIYRLSLGHPEVMRIFHLILGSLNCVLLFFIAKKLFSRRIAAVASLLMCFNFFIVYYDWLMMPVTLIIFLSLLIIYVLQNLERLSFTRHWIMLGLFVGLAILGDGKFLFFLIAVSGWLWLKEPCRRKHIIIMTLTALSILGLCAVRNKIVGGDWVMISAQSGLSFYAGNNPAATGTYSNPKFIRPTHQGQDEDQRIIAEAIVNRTMTPGAISKFWKSKALDFIKNHPPDYAKLLLKKLSLFLRETEDAHDMDLLFLREWKYRLNWNALAFLFPMALIGMCVSFSRWRSKPFISILIGCQLIMTLIFFLSTRHRATIVPFLLLFQSVAIFWMIKQIRQRHLLKIIFPIIFIIIFAAVFHPIPMDAAIIDYNRLAKAGAVYDKRGDLKNAKKNYYAALQYAPDDSTTLYNLGNIYVQEGGLKRAEQFYQSSLRICSYNVDALYNLAYVYEETGRPEAAFKLYQDVARSQPNTPDVYFRMANLYAKTGRCNQAIPLYKKAIALEPLLQIPLNPYILNCPYTPKSPETP